MRKQIRILYKFIAFLMIGVSLLNCKSNKIKSQSPFNEKQFSVKDVISNKNPHFGPNEYRYYDSKLKGVKKARIVFSLNKGDTNEILVPNDTVNIEYDGLGNKILHKDFEKSGWCNNHEYFYDSLNRLTKDLSYRCDNNINYISKTYYYKDSVVVNAKGLGGKMKIELDKNGNEIVYKTFSYGTPSIYWEKIYDSRGEKVMEFKFYWDSLEFYEAYEYDADGKLIKAIVLQHPEDYTNVYNSITGDEITAYTGADYRFYKYDTINNIITEKLFYSSGDTIIKDYYYDSYGSNFKIIKFNKNAVVDTTNVKEFEYDSLGNIIKERGFSKGKLYYERRTKYEYYR